MRSLLCSFGLRFFFHLNDLPLYSFAVFKHFISKPVWLYQSEGISQLSDLMDDWLTSQWGRTHERKQIWLGGQNYPAGLKLNPITLSAFLTIFFSLTFFTQLTLKHRIAVWGKQRKNEIFRRLKFIEHFLSNVMFFWGACETVKSVDVFLWHFLYIQNKHCPVADITQ